VSDTARQLAFQARRDALIRQMRDEGASFRTIAEVAGVSHQTIKNVLVRLEAPVAPV
jgi:lambda repressor-like predicted transcriptional regulator